MKRLGILVLALIMTFSVGCASDYGVTTVQQESKQEDDDKSVYTFTDSELTIEISWATGAIIFNIATTPHRLSCASRTA